jgi:hypothetical protein
LGSKLDVELFSPSSRFERLLIELTLAWLVQAKGDFAISLGPLNRFLSAIVNHALGEETLTEFKARNFLKHFARCVIRNVGLSAEAKLTIDESKVFVGNLGEQTK